MIMRNKTNSIGMIATAALLMAGLTACSSEILPEGDGGSEQQVAVSFITRAAADGTPTNPWQKDDQIGIYMDGFANKQNLSANVCYKANANGDFAANPSNLFFPTDGSAVSFCAYYPYTQSAANGVVADKLSDQADLLFAKNDGNGAGFTAKGGPVDLEFRHLKAKVSITVKPGNITVDELKKSTYSIGMANMTTDASLNVATGYLQDRVTAANAMQTLTTVAAGETYTALFYPDEESLEKNIQVLSNGKVLKATIPSYRWDAGVNYSYTLTVNDQSVKLLDGVTIIPWEATEQKETSISNVVIPELKDTEAGIFINYPDGATELSADNLRIGRANDWKLNYIWNPQSTPHVVVYAPYDWSTKYGVNTFPVSDDPRYASINADRTKTVKELLTGDGSALDLTSHPMTHLCAKLTVELKDAGGAALTGATLTTRSLHTKIAIDFATSNVSFSESASIALTAVADVAGSYECIVPPTAMPALVNLLTVTLAGGESYSYATSTEGFTFEAGCAYTLRLTTPAATRAALHPAQPQWTLTKKPR